jgi:succinate dehydrogenase / fumarate reductase cytochrome b subunit
MALSNQQYFLLRKLHQFTGALPLGAYLCIHLLVNSYALQGSTAFDGKVQILETLPFLFVWEFLLIYLPLVYHAAFGVWVGFVAKNNPLRFPYARNWNFAIQRWTGFFMLVFLGYHAWYMRFQGTPIGHTVQQFGFSDSGYGKVVMHLQNPAMAAFYAVGVIATAYHFANGLWEFLIDWGFTVSMKAQQWSQIAVMVVWIAISGLGLSALYAFATSRELPPGMGASTHAPQAVTAIAFQKGTSHGR